MNDLGPSDVRLHPKKREQKVIDNLATADASKHIKRSHSISGNKSESFFGNEIDHTEYICFDSLFTKVMKMSLGVGYLFCLHTNIRSL